MATVTLGNIKFNWKGAWNSGTAYVIDDVVSLSGSSYVSIQAGTNQNPASASAYWQQMSAAGTNGTNGTDLTTTLTAQGDILYRDGSGLQKLGAGTNGQFLKTQGTGANPTWADAGGGGKVLQWTNNHITTQYSNNSSSFGEFSGLQVFSITPSASTSKIAILTQFSGGCKNWNILKFQRKIGSGSYADFGLPSSASGNQSNAHFGGFYNSDDGTFLQVSWNYLDTPNTTDQVSYKLFGLSHNPNVIYLNRTHGNHNYNSNGNTTSSVMLLEIGA